MEESDLGNILPTEEKVRERLLGILWDPKTDSFRFQVCINLYLLRMKSRTGPDLSREQAPRAGYWRDPANA